MLAGPLVVVTCEGILLLQGEEQVKAWRRVWKLDFALQKLVRQGNSVGLSPVPLSPDSLYWGVAR